MYSLALLTNCHLTNRGANANATIVKPDKQISAKLPQLVAKKDGGKEQDMTTLVQNSFRFENIITIPWDGEAGIPELFIDNVQLAKKVQRNERAPVKVYVAPWGNIALLSHSYANNRPANIKLETAIGAQLDYFSAEGQLINQIDITPSPKYPSGWHIVDFSVDEAGYIYLLERYDSVEFGLRGHNHLRKLTSSGQLVWERSSQTSSQKLDLDALTGEFKQLSIDGNSTPYLIRTHPRNTVAKINPDNGSLEAYKDWEKAQGDIFIDSESKLHYFTYLPERKTHCWAYYDPSSQIERIMPCESSLDSLMTGLIGVDAQENGYFQSRWWLNRITNGSLSWRGQFSNLIFVEEENLLYTNNFLGSQNEDKLNIQAWDKNGLLAKEISLTIPSNLTSEGNRRQPLDNILGLGNSSVKPSLVYLEQGKYYVYAGETPTRDGTLLIYSLDGTLEEQQYPAPEMHLQENLTEGNDWNVDSAGNIYIPLLGAKNFHLIKVTLPPPQ